MAKILIVDDEALQRNIMCEILSSAGHSTFQAENVDSALVKISEENPAIVFTDLKMNGRTGIDLVQELSAMEFSPEIVVLTAFGSVETAVKAMKLGAYDYLTKPLDHDQLLLVVERCLQRYNLRSEGYLIRKELTRQAHDGLIAESAAMKQVLAMVQKVAASDMTVLIRGESGTGKERIARLVHYLGPRGSKPMQTVNCAAFPDNLLESELFGYEKGAFTGAGTRKPGIIETAEGGTLFLDEIGDMPLNTQAKILRVLQEKEYRPLGGTSSVKANIRIIAATNRPLESCVKQGSFREDLFYRLNILPIVIPPLKTRKEDIPPLVSWFTSRRGPLKTVSGEAMQCLLRYDWPGNVRELEAVMERVIILSSGSEITPADLPPEIQCHSVSVREGFCLPEQGIVFEDLERSMLEQALQKANGVVAEAARLLGMTYRTFQYRADKFNLTQKD